MDDDQPIKCGMCGKPEVIVEIVRPDQTWLACMRCWCRFEESVCRQGAVDRFEVRPLDARMIDA